MSQPLFRDVVVRLVARTTLIVVLLTASYYLFPIDWTPLSGDTAGRSSGALLGLAGVVLVILWQRRSFRSGRYPLLARVEVLLTALYLLVLLFAVIYFCLDQGDGQRFSGLTNRTDALYFSVTVISTVGFGDIHAASTGARAIVSAQMIFDLIYLGIALRALGSAKGAAAGAAQR